MTDNYNMKKAILYACLALTAYTSALPVSRRGANDCPTTCATGSVEETQSEANRIWNLTLTGSGSSICDGRSPKADVMMTAPLDACLRKAYTCELDTLEAEALEDCEEEEEEKEEEEEEEEEEKEDIAAGGEYDNDAGEPTITPVPANPPQATATPSQHSVRKEAPAEPEANEVHAESVAEPEATQAEQDVLEITTTTIKPPVITVSIPPADAVHVVVEAADPVPDVMDDTPVVPAVQVIPMVVLEPATPRVQQSAEPIFQPLSL